MAIHELQVKVINLSKKFNQLNSPTWKEKKSDTSGYILIEAYNDTNTNMIIGATIAKAISTVHNLRPIVLSSKTSFSEEHENIYSSFGIKESILFDKRSLGILKFIHALFDYVKLCFVYRKLRDLLSFSKDSVLLGDLMYDEFIRNQNNYRKYSFHSAKFFVFFIKFMVKHYFNVELLNKYDFKYVILSHRVYSIASLHRLALNKSICSIITRITSVRLYTNKLEALVNEYKPSIEVLSQIKQKQKYEKMDIYLAERFAGNIDQHDVRNAFVNKENFTKDELLNSFQIENHNPIVFIMPHAFSDANHSNEFILFDDYYSWFIETLDYIDKIKNVNWFVKPHPSSFLYNEIGEVEDILKNYSQHIHLAPENLNTSSIFTIAKTIVTISGTVGIEAACMGIKPIIAGDSTYRGFGIAEEPATKKDYFELLHNIEPLDTKLNDEQKITAKSILYWLHIGSFIPSDIFEKKAFVPGANLESVLKQKINFYKNMINKLESNKISEDNFFKSVVELIRSNGKYNVV